MYYILGKIMYFEISIKEMKKQAVFLLTNVFIIHKLTTKAILANQTHTGIRRLRTPPNGLKRRPHLPVVLPAVS